MMYNYTLSIDLLLPTDEKQCHCHEGMKQPGNNWFAWRSNMLLATPFFMTLTSLNQLVTPQRQIVISVVNHPFSELYLIVVF